MVGMGVVSKLYDEGVIFLPNVMMSADAMLAGIEFVKQKAGKHLRSKEKLSVTLQKVMCMISERISWSHY